MTNNETVLGNIEAEEAILGGILLDPEAIARVADKLPTSQSQFSRDFRRYFGKSPRQLRLGDLKRSEP